MPSRGLRLSAGPSCPSCRAPFDMERLASGAQHCPACGLAFEAVRFHPTPPRVAVHEVGASGPQQAASCAVHRRNAAVGSCARCGIFMCALCRTEADGQELCAACFDRLTAQGALESTHTRHRDYVGLAWIAVAAGVFICGAGLVTGPLAVYYGVRALRQLREWGDEGGRLRVAIPMMGGVVVFAVGTLMLIGILKAS